MAIAAGAAVRSVVHRTVLTVAGGSCRRHFHQQSAKLLTARFLGSADNARRRHHDDDDDGLLQPTVGSVFGFGFTNKQPSSPSSSLSAAAAAASSSSSPSSSPSSPSPSSSRPITNTTRLFSVKGGISLVQMSALRPIVLCGPSGSGKSTLLKRLLTEHGKWFALSVSHTTRKPRPGEVDGKDYHFVTRDEMLEAIDNGEFIEHTEFSGNIYGTSKRAVQDVIDKGHICVLDIEIEGVKSIKNTDLNPRYVFIKPPSIQVLEERLRCRGTESEESLAKRLTRAVEELQYGEEEGNFDLLIVNDNLKVAYETLENFLIKEIEDLSGKKPEF